jgi:hypothetical protein
MTEIVDVRKVAKLNILLALPSAHMLTVSLSLTMIMMMMMMMIIIIIINIS